MPSKSHLAWLPLLVAIPCAAFAQGLAPSIQQHNVRDWVAEESGYLRNLEVATGSEGDQRAAIYRSCLSLASLYQDRHQYADAEKNYQCAYTLAKALFGDRSRETAIALNLLGLMQLQQSRVHDADGAFHQALQLLASEQDANSLQTAAVLNNLAAVEQANGNLSRAAALIRKVVGMFEADPTADQEVLGTAASNLAIVLRDTGGTTEAITAARRAVSIFERCCPHSDKLAVGLITLSRLAMDEGDPAGAEALLHQALIEQQSLEDSPARAVIFCDLGVLYTHTGRNREAEPYFQRALEIDRRLLGPDHPKLLDVMEAYAVFLRAAKRKSEAKKLETYVREARERYRVENPWMGNAVDARSLVGTRAH